MHSRIAQLAVIGTVLTIALGADAEAAMRPSIDGSCELSGVARFDHPATNAVEANGGTFHSQAGLGNCIGTLRLNGSDLASGQIPVRARARATGDFSCLSGGLGGRAVMTFLDQAGSPLRVNGRKVKVRSRIAMAHAVAAGSIEFLGAGGSSAGGIYNFTPSGGAIAGCAQGGDSSLPMSVRYTTRGEFQSLRRRR
jgi:hypothetical protein